MSICMYIYIINCIYIYHIYINGHTHAFVYDVYVCNYTCVNKKYKYINIQIIIETVISYLHHM